MLFRCPYGTSWCTAVQTFDVTFFFLRTPSPTTCIPDYTHTCIHNISSSPYLSSVRLPSDVAALRTQRRFVSSFQIMKIFIYKHINMNMNAVLCCAVLCACDCVSPSHPRTLAQKCTQLHWKVLTIFGISQLLAVCEKRNTKKINKFKNICR